MPDDVFTKVDFTTLTLVDRIATGQIGLPDIQRPFVWEPSKVRDLFDSMYRGYPVGHLLLWESGAEPGTKQIGSGDKQEVPKLLIVDGQQRLTSLFAVMRARPVVGKDYRSKRIRIAFRPKDRFFAVADAAVVKDPAFIPDISEMWTGSPFALITEFMSRLTALDALEDGDDVRLPEALQRLHALETYSFTALVLGANVSEEQVADVFVRINSKGKNLNQADFILTLMSVFWDEGRAQLERWSREARTPGDAAANPYVSPDPDQLLRVAIALGFRRARLQDAYPVLRGRDPGSGRITPDARDAQFARLAEAQARVLDKAVWKEFLQSLLRAGHRSSTTISSNTAIFYAYALYLIGRHDYGVKPKVLRDVIARWFFMSSMTSRYSASAETRMEADLGSLPRGNDPDAFVARLDEIIERSLTNDYWEITLPNDLATSAARGPTLFAYVASLCNLNAPVLFSKMGCAELLDPTLVGPSPKLQRHHLFPRKFLEQSGVGDMKQINQIANLALLEWHDNLAISASDPAVYWPAYLDAMRNPPPGMAAFSDKEIAVMLHLHALDFDWPAMDYESFLERRRRGIARVIREGFEQLSKGVDGFAALTWPPSRAAIEHLLAEGETYAVEMKSSLRADTLGTGIPPKAVEKIAARTVAGFLNKQGGILIIGADDDGIPLGLDADIAMLQRKDFDGFQQTLVQVLASHLGPDVAASVRIHVGQVGPDDRPIALVECDPHPTPVFLGKGPEAEFHVRTGNTTRKLDLAEASAYVSNHWRGFAVQHPGEVA